MKDRQYNDQKKKDKTNNAPLITTKQLETEKHEPNNNSDELILYGRPCFTSGICRGSHL
jgi:hypothetical protein